jgi:hypothetical protein
MFSRRAGSLPVDGSGWTVSGVLLKTRATMPAWVSLGCRILADCFYTQSALIGFLSILCVDLNRSNRSNGFERCAVVSLFVEAEASPNFGEVHDNLLGFTSIQHQMPFASLNIVQQTQNNKFTIQSPSSSYLAKRGATFRRYSRRHTYFESICERTTGNVMNH